MKQIESLSWSVPGSLAWSLVLQIRSSPFSTVFWSPTNWFSPQNRCHISLNLPLFGLGPTSKGLGTDLKLLTYNIAWIHQSLDPGPSSKVALSFTICFSISYLECTHIYLFTSVFFFFFFFFSIFQFVNFFHFFHYSSIFLSNSHCQNKISQFLQKTIVATVRKSTKKNHCSAQNLFCFSTPDLFAMTVHVIFPSPPRLLQS